MQSHIDTPIIPRKNSICGYVHQLLNVNWCFTRELKSTPKYGTPNTQNANTQYDTRAATAEEYANTLYTTHTRLLLRACLLS